MNLIQHNLEKEKRLIELLGYNLVGPNGSNRWLILDGNQNQVGYIQYKKLCNGNSKKGYSKIFGYHTFINSSNIVYEFLDATEVKLAIGETYVETTNPIVVYEDLIDVTMNATITKTIVKKDTGETVTTIDTSVAGIYVITYSASYKDTSKSFTKTVIIE